MRVHFFNTFLQGGAAEAAINQFLSLKDAGVDGSFFYMRNIEEAENPVAKRSDFICVNPYLPKKNPINRILKSIKARFHFNKQIKFLKNRPTGFEQFSFPNQFFKTKYSDFDELPDVIHIHWIAEWIDYESFFASIPNSIPIVFTLHDENAFTAGCHYAWDCEQFKTGCMNCPQLNPEHNSVSEFYSFKAKALQNKLVYVVGNSNWTLNEARKSPIFSNAKLFKTIHLGIDVDIFKPLINKDLRQKYNVGNNAFVIAFGAASFTNKRKGLDVLLESLTKLHSKSIDFVCVTFGDSLAIADYPFKIISVGKVKEKQQLAEIYSLADIFVIPSLQEAFGLTSIEAMACSTPVVGFDTGGISDSIQHKITGLLCDSVDADSLVSSLEYCICNSNELAKMSENTREFVLDNFTFEKQKNQYIELYNRCL